MRGGSLGEPVAAAAGARPDLDRVREIAKHYWRI
jgi:hypothetical protein